MAYNIEKMLGIQDRANKKNAAAIEKSCTYFDLRYVKITVPYSFYVGKVVLINKKGRLDSKNFEVHWIRSCTVVYEHLGHAL